MIVLSIDPGKVNMGYAVIRRSKTGYKILRLGMFKNTIQDLKPKNLKPAILQFQDELNQIIDKFSVSAVAIERFVSRGLLGSLSEYICIMQGMIAVHPKIKYYNLIIPSTWKNCFNKSYQLKLYYKEASRLKIQPHELDAALIGIYYLNKEVYKSFRRPKFRTKFLSKLSMNTNGSLF